MFAQQIRRQDFVHRPGLHHISIAAVAGDRQLSVYGHGRGSELPRLREALAFILRLAR